MEIRVQIEGDRAFVWSKTSDGHVSWDEYSPADAATVVNRLLVPRRVLWSDVVFFALGLVALGGVFATNFWRL